MPGGDRTGPEGMGARTGRGAGDCAPVGFNAPVRGWGRRGGWRNRGGGAGRPRMGLANRRGGWWGAPLTQEDEADLLKAQAKQLQTELDALQQRLTELEDK